MKQFITMDSQLLSSIMSCPRTADFRFNQSLVEVGGKGNALEVGSLAHVILEWFNKAIIDGKSRSDAIDIGYEAGKEYVRGWTEINKFITDPEEKGLVNTPEESQKVDKKSLIGWKYVYETMDQYFDYYKNDMFPVIHSEFVKGDVIYDDEDLAIFWKAKYDAIYDMPNGLMSWDHKTMSQNRDTTTLNNQFIGQCRLLGSRNILINKIGWQTSLPANEKFQRTVISYTADKISEWCNEIVPYYARLWIAFSEAESFPANYTHCENKYGWCKFYQHVCSADRNIREQALKVYFKVGKKWDVSND